MILLIGLLFWAVIKAGLVGWFFMHLKFEGNWVYIMIVPAFVLATILVLALLPDMALKENADEPIVEETSYCAADTRTAEACSYSVCANSKRACSSQGARAGMSAALLPLPLGEGRGEGPGTG